MPVLPSHRPPERPGRGECSVTLSPDDRRMADLKALLIATLGRLGDAEQVAASLRARGLKGDRRPGLNPISALMRALGAPAATATPDELGFQNNWLAPAWTFNPPRGVSEFLR